MLLEVSKLPFAVAETLVSGWECIILAGVFGLFAPSLDDKFLCDRDLDGLLNSIFPSSRLQAVSAIVSIPLLRIKKSTEFREGPYLLKRTVRFRKDIGISEMAGEHRIDGGEQEGRCNEG